METFHIIFLFTCDAVHVYTAAMEESEHCHLVFRVLPMGRCACIFCSALLYDVPETRKCVEIVKTHFLSLILLLFLQLLVFSPQTGQRGCRSGSRRGNGLGDSFSSGKGARANCDAAASRSRTPAERSVLQSTAVTTGLSSCF